jgi:hypothetical protein
MLLETIASLLPKPESENGNPPLLLISKYSHPRQSVNIKVGSSFHPVTSSLVGWGQNSLAANDDFSCAIWQLQLDVHAPKDQAGLILCILFYAAELFIGRISFINPVTYAFASAICSNERSLSFIRFTL